ncbi:MAG: hypothetical protein PUE51_06370 [Veillonellaceae bacterium]|nr:hypothetical protein [Veillonellaceae bacterium]
MKRFAKAIALSLCVTTASYTLGTAAPAFAAEAATETEHDNSKPGAWKPVTFSTETAKSTEVVSTIPKGEAYIPKGTKLEVSLAKELSSKKAHVGDPVPLKLDENLVINNVVVIPAGTEVEGVVTQARKAGGLGRGGKLEFAITSIKTKNNVEVPLDFHKGEHGAGDAGAAAVFAAVSIVGGLFMKGKNVIYNEGMKFDVEVTKDTDLKTKLTDLEETMANAQQGVVVTIQ